MLFWVAWVVVLDVDMSVSVALCSSEPLALAWKLTRRRRPTRPKDADSLICQQPSGSLQFEQNRQ